LPQAVPFAAPADPAYAAPAPLPTGVPSVQMGPAYPMPYPMPQPAGFVPGFRPAPYHLTGYNPALPASYGMPLPYGR
jgi:hypothetical protein